MFLVMQLPMNFDYVKKLGASRVVDYNGPTIADELINAQNNCRRYFNR